MKGYKMVKDDYKVFYDTPRRDNYVYKPGNVLVHPNPDMCHTACGHGLHISKEPYNPLWYNARYPWRLLEVKYQPKDIIYDDGDKVRVKKLTVVKELKPWDLGLPNGKRVFEIISRASKIELRGRTKKAEKGIKTLVKRHVVLLNKRYRGKELIILKQIRFYSIKQWASVWASVRASVWDSVWDNVRTSVWASVWDSVRASVWDSVWASVWDSVRASVWASVRTSVWDSVRTSVWASVKYPNSKNPFLPLLEINELGGVFYGIDKNGIAYVIMPSKDEIKKED